MFRGHAYRTLDTKGRLILPPEFREIVLSQDEGGRIMLTNLDGCVVGYTYPQWLELEQSFNEINLLNRRLRDFQRFFISGAKEVVMDSQGRILLPPHLRKYARLNRDIVLAGVGHKFEIWDQERFEMQISKVEEDFDSLIDDLYQNGYELKI
ncbi:division/cell wall cluster transcriptional repressor MraZ [Desulfothermus okinawensis]